MTTQAATVPQDDSATLPDLPQDVLAFAEEKGAAAYLPGVLAMTRRVWPQGEVSVRVEEDYEDSNCRFVLFEVDGTGYTSEELLRTMKQWTREIVNHCPTTHTPYFTYSVRMQA